MTCLDESARVQLAEFLNTYEFPRFITGTFREPRTVKSCRGVAEKLAKELGAGKDCNFVWFAEPHRAKDNKVRIFKGLRYHFHALTDSDRSTQLIWNWYYPRFGFIDIRTNSAPDVRKAASYYLTKYVTKKIQDYELHLKVIR
jgi:hypothetical protein